jgi:hypothetical protein
MTHSAHPPQGHPAPSTLAALVLCCGWLLLASAAHAQDPAPPSREALLQQADQIEGKVAQLRNLTVKAPIRKAVKDKDELRRYITAKLDQESPAAELERDARTLARLGLLPEGYPYRAAVLDLLTEQIAGFYDNDTQELNLIADGDLASQEIVAAHELYHALQDQHYDLKRLQGPEEGLLSADHNEDLSLARSSLIEGDATIVMIDYLSFQGGLFGPGGSLLDQPTMASMIQGQLTSFSSMPSESPAMAAVPKWMQESLVFPYVAGLGFVIAMREPGSWARMDRTYADPPQSTEQILHPERYLSRDVPTLVTLDHERLGRALGGDKAWTAVDHVAMGEFQLGQWLEHHLTPAQAAQAASPSARPLPNPKKAADGWDGDRLYSFEEADTLRTVLVQVSIWDTPQEAQEFVEALGAMTRARRPDASRTTQGGPLGGLDCFSEPAERTFIERWGEWVLYVDGLPDSANLSELREVAWDSRRSAPYPSATEKP